MESFLGFEVLTNRLNSIRLPTMILNGEFDFLTPRSLHDTLRTQIPNSALIILFPAPFTPLRWRRQP
jgi:3-oxoadipate enol-lactonase